jgi:ketosteroid isomerase-like protein
MSTHAIWERAHELVKAYDLGRFADMFAADGVLELPFAPHGVPRLEGREAIRRFLVPAGEAAKGSGRRILRYNNVIVHETTDPDVIVVEFDLHGASDAGGPYQYAYIQVMRVRDDEIALLRDYIDPRVFGLK